MEECVLTVFVVVVVVVVVVVLFVQLCVHSLPHSYYNILLPTVCPLLLTSALLIVIITTSSHFIHHHCDPHYHHTNSILVITAITANNLPQTAPTNTSHCTPLMHPKLLIVVGVKHVVCTTPLVS